MALHFIDGVYWDITDIGYKYYSNSDVTLSSATRRSGPKSIALAKSLLSTSVLVLELPNLQTVVYGCAFKIASGLSSLRYIIKFRDATTNIIQIGLGSDNSFTVNTGGGTYTTIPGLLIVDTWTYLELKFEVGTSTGSFEFRVNETIRLTQSDIQVGSDSAEIDFLRWEHTGETNTYGIQDIYVCDQENSVNDDFLGDIKVDVIRPNAVGTHTDFTPSAGANWENTDEVPVDEDGTYNVSTTVDQKDIYNYEDISIGSASILGLQQQSVYRKDDVGQFRAKQLFKSGTTETLGVELQLSDSYAGYRQLFDINPDTSTAWTETTVNAIETGIKTV